jgi:hypothetical protein
VYTLVGLGIGLLTHPYFPRNVEFAFYHLLPKAIPSEQPNITVGSEWYPYSPAGFLLRAGSPTAMVLLGLVPIGIALWQRRWPEWRSMVLGILALGFLAMTAASQRIMEYFPAFAVIFFAWSWSHHPGTLETVARLARPRLPERLAHGIGRLGPAAPWIAALIVAPFVTSSTLIASKLATEGVPWTAYRDGALWLAKNTPPGSRVFTTGWDDFPHMFFWDQNNTYLVGLDPTYMSLEDPAVYTLWRSISQGRVPNPSQIIREQFDSPYLLTDLEHKRFLEVAAADPGLEEVLRTRTVVVYRVRGG